MSCPFATGTIALWLQANPTLSPDDIKEIFSRTAIQDQEGETYPNSRWGWGKIDAYKGLLDVLGLPTASENIFEEKPYEAVSVYAGTSPGSFHALGEDPALSASKCSMPPDVAGMAIRWMRLPPWITWLFLGTDQPGVYFVRIETAEGTVERKIKLIGQLLISSFLECPLLAP